MSVEVHVADEGVRGVDGGGMGKGRIRRAEGSEVSVSSKAMILFQRLQFREKGK